MSSTNIPGTNTSRDQAGQIVTSRELPPSGASTNIIGSGGVKIPATMVGGVAVTNKSK
jgi:hypothetical protein